MPELSPYIPSLTFRILAGILVLSFLAYGDWKKHPNDPTRLKEYLYLLTSVLLTLSYAVIHDLITVTISPEYFIAGKGIPPGPNFYWRVCWLAIRGSYWVGLIIGVTFLIANNPSKKWQKLPYPILYRQMFIPVGCALILAPIFGALFSADAFGHMKEVMGAVDFPDKFVLVWGIHHGSYLGGLVGLLLGTTRILYLRSKTSN